MNIDNKANFKYLEKNYGKNILPLSIFEQTMPGAQPIEVLLFYKKGTPIPKLKESFFKAAEYYNLFSSRLILIGDNKFALQYCTDGIEYNLLSPINVTFDNINIDDIKKMMVHVKTLPGEPLLALTGIPIKDGVLGAISCSHAIADGISLILFLYVWGCIIEGKDFPLPSPQRLFKGDPIRSDQIDKALIPPLSELSDAIQNRVKLDSNVKTYAKREYFTDEFLNDIKNKAKSENEKYIISNNQIITSFLLKKYHSVILPNTDRIILRTPVSFRDIHPDIDSLYIGNAQYYCVTEYKKDEIDKMSIYDVAYRLKESIMDMRDESFIKKLSYVSNYGIEVKTDILKNNPPGNMDADILSSNLTHLNDLDSLGLGADIGSILYISLAYYKTNFIMLKEKSGRIFAEITSRYPL